MVLVMNQHKIIVFGKKIDLFVRLLTILYHARRQDKYRGNAAKLNEHIIDILNKCGIKDEHSVIYKKQFNELFKYICFFVFGEFDINEEDNNNNNDNNKQKKQNH